jgi:hypothetical protein
MDGFDAAALRHASAGGVDLNGLSVTANQQFAELRTTLATIAAALPASPAKAATLAPRRASVFTLLDQPITGDDNAIGPVRSGLDGLTAITIEASFAYGAGAGVVGAIVQTTFDDGVTWRDIARFDFAKASVVKHCNLEGLLSKKITAYAPLAVEGVNDGVLGNQLRAAVTATGRYQATTLSVRVAVR